MFLGADPNAVLGMAAAANNFDLSQPQRDAWVDQLPLLRSALAPYAGRGRVFLEYEIPRLGKRVDAVVIIDHVVFVIEFKVGESKETLKNAIEMC